MWELQALLYVINLKGSGGQFVEILTLVKTDGLSLVSGGCGVGWGEV